MSASCQSRRFKAVRATLLGVAALVGLVSGPARATQLYVQDGGNAPAGGDPNLIAISQGVNIGVAGHHTLQDPLLIVVGVLNGDSTTPTPTISSSYCGGACSLATPSSSSSITYGLTTNKIQFTSGDAFQTLGLQAGGSESFGNWSGADLADLGFTATSYELFVYQINIELSSANSPPGGATASPITITFDGVGVGSWILAYDCELGTGTDSGCGTKGDISQTVFTNTGLVTGLPEPTSLTLLGTAFAGVFAARRRRRAR